MTGLPTPVVFEIAFPTRTLIAWQRMGVKYLTTEQDQIVQLEFWLPLMVMRMTFVARSNDGY